MYEILIETKRNLSERSQYYLLKKGMSVLQLSKRINRVYSFTYRLVNNGNKMFIEEGSVELLAKEFGVSPQEMILPLTEEERSEFETLLSCKNKKI